MEPESSAIEEIHCQHHWIIEPSAGPTSNGVCQRCGAEKEFQNSPDVPSAGWQRRERPAEDTEK